MKCNLCYNDGLNFLRMMQISDDIYIYIFFKNARLKNRCRIVQNLLYILYEILNFFPPSKPIEQKCPKRRIFFPFFFSFFFSFFFIFFFCQNGFFILVDLFKIFLPTKICHHYFPSSMPLFSIHSMHWSIFLKLNSRNFV